MAKETTSEGKRLLAKQGDYEVGNKKPPKEHQFKPGQSGNPAGPPIRRTQLWVYFSQYMAMTDAEIEKLDSAKLTQSEQMALSLVEKEAKAGSRALALAIFDREEGRALQTQVRLAFNRLLEDGKKWHSSSVVFSK